MWLTAKKEKPHTCVHCGKDSRNLVSKYEIRLLITCSMPAPSNPYRGSKDIWLTKEVKGLLPKKGDNILSRYKKLDLGKVSKIQVEDVTIYVRDKYQPVVRATILVTDLGLWALCIQEFVGNDWEVTQ